MYVCVPNFKSIPLKIAFLVRFKGRKWPLFEIFLCIAKHFCFSFLCVFACAERGSLFIFRAQDDKTTEKHVSWGKMTHITRPRMTSWPRMTLTWPKVTESSKWCIWVLDTHFMSTYVLLMHLSSIKRDRSGNHWNSQHFVFNLTSIVTLKPRAHTRGGGTRARAPPPYEVKIGKN